MVNFIHTADIHANKERKKICLTFIEKIKQLAIEKKEKTGVLPKILIAGDFFHSMLSNTESSGFYDYLKAMKDLTETAPVFIVTGTPSHDVTSSLKPFKLLGIKVYENFTFEEFEDFELVALPEPRKSWVSKDAKSYKEINEYLVNEINNFISSLPDKKKPRIVLGHGDVIGAVYQNGVSATSPIAFSKSQLEKINADYYAFGHIHNPQKVNGISNCYYSGSLANGFGETHESGVYYVEVK